MVGFFLFFLNSMLTLKKEKNFKDIYSLLHANTSNKNRHIRSFCFWSCPHPTAVSCVMLLCFLSFSPSLSSRIGNVANEINLFGFSVTSYFQGSLTLCVFVNAYMYICILPAYLVLKGARRRYLMPWKCSSRKL